MRTKSQLSSKKDVLAGVVIMRLFSLRGKPIARLRSAIPGCCCKTQSSFADVLWQQIIALVPVMLVKAILLSNDLVNEGKMPFTAQNIFPKEPYSRDVAGRPESTPFTRHGEDRWQSIGALHELHEGFVERNCYQKMPSIVCVDKTIHYNTPSGSPLLLFELLGSGTGVHCSLVAE